ncbi:SAC3 family protein like [Quillaja saponaria]|uniref:SAC3 family protein like n=1 Tax=Quillaja saponaria TaxID=32244 RepID=A0AAD7QER4_QUISA|nr:SAC3 family protein like [Quillaja saponaria]
MSYRGFGKGSGPTGPPKSQPPFGHNPFIRATSSSPSTPPFPIVAPLRSPSPRSTESPGWSDRQRPVFNEFDAQNHQRPYVVTSFVASRESAASVTAKVSRIQNPERIRSPPLPSGHEELRHSAQIFFEMPAVLLNKLDNQVNPPGKKANFMAGQVQSLGPSYLSSSGSRRNSPTESDIVQVSKRTRSPSSPSANENLQEIFSGKDFKRPSISPPRLGSRSNVLNSGPNEQFYQKSLPSTVSEAAVTKPVSSGVPKRTRSPPLSTNHVLQGNTISTQEDSERELQAKAKRLARFKVELSKSEQGGPDIADQKDSANLHEQSVMEQKYVRGHSAESAGDLTNGHALSDYEGLNSSNIICGLCPDMCPESERGERERKGDLDQYERLDGDRNVTSRLLAVKKYTRTAEREASLIRPMPILQRTIDYLLNLLNQPYDDRFLGTYNFLWDRMRAIRMDLRMQHIFNQGAITMLEQMIRLHILAMHELCEYTKGEGFSEGFDAHLNIEQMNKTSVELFQLYDDHRKKGIDVLTEKEFRGYYALLKLDKHPGYKVEPAELSLDLAKMTPGIRQTPEVLFARNVARACRTGNFIAFFRLARKASYLQACLMHAHFAKLRTQALASLHAGLQNNQGLPVAHVANWLGMEDEAIEELLEYHGFLLKAFEEPYMVKEGPFLNVDNDYPTKCSKLVLRKRSGRIIGDVLTPAQVVSPPAKSVKKKHEQKTLSSVQQEIPVHKIDEVPENEAVLSPKHSMLGQAIIETPIISQRNEEYHVSSPRLSPLGFSFSSNKFEQQLSGGGFLRSPNSDANFRSSQKRNLCSDMDRMPLEMVPKTAPEERSVRYSFSFPVENFVPQSVSEDEPPVIHQGNEVENDQDAEIAQAKLKLFLRLWRRRSLKLRELREQRHLAANVALNSLSLGPPIRQKKDQLCNFGNLDIDNAMRERYEKHDKSWARLNVSDVIADILSRRNLDVKCFCWKLILCSLHEGDRAGAAGLWLFSKIMPSSDDGEDDLVTSTPGLVIWKKWARSQPGADLTCCLSVIKNTKFSTPDETISGASAVLFLVSESIPWEFQRVQLHNLLMSIPTGARLPLLILCGSYEEKVVGFSSIIINELGLDEIDQSRISGFLVVFLVENQQMEHLNGFFSDTRLREGLEWLAIESPLPPILNRVKTRELVLAHLDSLLGVNDQMIDCKIGPNECISFFNEALAWSVQDIGAAANGNPVGWPCPEIGLLNESSDEHRMVRCYMPSIGWSSVAVVEPLVCALRNCELPTFIDDLSWLPRGSNIRKDIESHRIKLENYLIRYLTLTSKMMGVSLATKEARVMVQRCARFELQNSCYHIVPQWIKIFRRIFNWRLMSLSNGNFPSAYIMECHHVTCLSPEGSLPSPDCLNPSLDEIIKVGCGSLSPGVVQPRSEVFWHPLAVAPIVVDETVNTSDFMDAESSFAQDGEWPSGCGSLSPGAIQPRSEVFRHPLAVAPILVDETVNTSDFMDAESSFAQDGEWPSKIVAGIDGLNNGRSRTEINGKETKEAEKLSKLLEQCNILQGKIDEKLCIYF